MVLGVVGEMTGELVSQSVLAVRTISGALVISVFGMPSKSATYKPKKPSPRAGTPSPMLGEAGAGAVAASPREQKQLYTVEQQQQQRRGERPSSATSYYSFTHQTMHPPRGTPAEFDTKMQSEKQGEATFPEQRFQHVMRAQEASSDEECHLHHPPLHLPTIEGEELAAGGMAMEEGGKLGGSFGGHPRSGPFSRRSSSGHVKQVTCSVM